MKTILSTADAPAAIGPYSQAVRSGETLYCSGQLGIDPATGKLPEGVAAQTEQSLKNIRALLAAAGAGIENVVKTTVFITNMADFPLVNAEYSKVFDKILTSKQLWLRNKNTKQELEKGE